MKMLLIIPVFIFLESKLQNIWNKILPLCFLIFFLFHFLESSVNCKSWSAKNRFTLFTMKQHNLVYQIFLSFITGILLVKKIDFQHIFFPAAKLIFAYLVSINQNFFYRFLINNKIQYSFNSSSCAILKQIIVIIVDPVVIVIVTKETRAIMRSYKINERMTERIKKRDPEKPISTRVYG